mmetsp:Transcript_18519/g.38540  ORF Transcript_18519/g.38540 Transcript_18519/m.38540 type:complete len:203 (-) Transcript_18519:912-1520(-)
MGKLLVAFLTHRSSSRHGEDHFSPGLQAVSLLLPLFFAHALLHHHGLDFHDGRSPLTASGGNFVLEPLHLLPELFDKFSRRVLIDYGLRSNLLCALCVPQGGHRLAIVHPRGAHGTKHSGLSISSQTILKQHGEHRVSERDLLEVHRPTLISSISQTAYALPEGGQGLVDLRSLFQPRSCCSRAPSALGPGQVNEHDPALLL